MKPIAGRIKVFGFVVELKVTQRPAPLAAIRLLAGFAAGGGEADAAPFLLHFGISCFNLEDNKGICFIIHFRQYLVVICHFVQPLCLKKQTDEINNLH